jgi:hypothetical protein
MPHQKSKKIPASISFVDANLANRLRRAHASLGFPPMTLRQITFFALTEWCKQVGAGAKAKTK